MNSKTYLFSVSLCLFSIIAHADDTPFKVSVSPEYGRNSTYFWQYKIISKENDLIIQSLEVNRGKCNVNEEFRRAYEKRKDLHERSESILDRAYGKGRKKNVFTEEMPEYYKKLNFSEAFFFSVTTNAKFSYCEPMELTVGTNQGNYTVSWDN